MKAIRDFRISAAVAAFLLTLAVALGGFSLYQRLGINQPIVRDMTAIQGVAGVTLDRSSQIVTVQVQLGRVDDLKSVYQQLDVKARQYLSDKPYQIKIADQADSTMTQAHDAMEMGIYQGIQENSYLWLNDWYAKSARKQHYVGRIKIDDKRLYITLTDGKQDLYRVYDRLAPNASGTGGTEQK
ncbi:MAG: hypothetical protein ACM3QZ_03770 [Solirubrobacterales bacterium]